MGNPPKPKIHEIREVTVEHLLGAATSKGLVKLRVAGPTAVMVDELTPANARNIAAHLMEAAARAEYEQDLYTELTAEDGANFEPEIAALVLYAVRQGERKRHES